MYTYAFLKTPLTPLTLPQGMTDMVQITAAGQLSAVIEPAVDIDRLQQDDTRLVQAVLAHDRILRSLFLQTTILPLRFGTTFNSLQSLLTHLNSHQETYLSKLAQLEGKAEYTLKLTPVPFPECAIAPEVKGKDYFVAKKQQYQAQLSYQKQQEAAVGQIAQEMIQTNWRYHCTETEAGDKTLYLLVGRDREDQLCQYIQTLQEQYPQWDLKLGEALPPYHFVAD